MAVAGSVRHPSPSLVALTLVCAVVLGGCLGFGKDRGDKGDEPPGTGPPGGGPNGNGTPPGPLPNPLDRWVDLSQCVQLFTLLPTDSPTVNDHLPEGYLAATALPLVVPLNLNVLTCSAIIVDNQTVIKDTQVAYTAAAVSVDENLTAPGLVDTYVFEMFFDNETLRAVFEQTGFPARMANIEMDAAGLPITASVSVDGTLWYEFAGAVDENPSEKSGIRREHALAPDGRSIWYDFNMRYNTNDITTEGVVQAHAGVLQDLSVGGTGVYPAIASTGDITGSIRFGEYPPKEPEGTT